MSYLITSHDLHLIMLEFVVNKIFLPKIANFNGNSIHDTIVLFRVVDDWISVTAQSKDDSLNNRVITQQGNPQNGVSVVFAIPAIELQRKVSNVYIEVHVQRNTSKYSYVGNTRVPIDSLFNGIIKDIKERKEMREHFTYYHKREPISRSMKSTYAIIDDCKSNDSSSITIYTRLNYFGKSIITQIESFSNGEFYTREETCEGNPYQCREVDCAQLKIIGWYGDNSEQSLPVKPKDLIFANNGDTLQRVIAETETTLNVGDEQKMKTRNVPSSMDEKLTIDDVNKTVRGAVNRRSKYGNGVKKKKKEKKKKRKKR